MAEKKVKEEIMEQELEQEEYLFEGGPKLSKVEEWNSLYKNVYMTEFEDGEIFIWRTLRRKEFKDIMKVEGADAMYREERVCEKCVLWPEKYDFIAMTTGKAGVPTLLSEQIMDRSGFTSKSGPVML
jgi:hypothetical protein